ncbi:MAG: SGNH/GDSL hydrolase family protein [Elusimicrobia bacterium]|nr:SGNH/GDSL hydrolase family protein [Elusimicrobiota bacterium]
MRPLNALAFALTFAANALPVRAAALTGQNREEIRKLIGARDTYLAYSAELGWTLRPSAGSGAYRTNSAGLRADQEYPPKAPPGVLRAAAFGDSYVHGDDVAGKDTWTAFASSSGTSVEVLNYGVSAYGLDQALLRYKLEGGRFHPDFVLIGFMAATLHRNISTFRPFWDPAAGMPFAKPRFILKDGRLVLIPNPMAKLADYRSLLENPELWLPQLAAHDWFYQRRHGGASDAATQELSYNPGSEGFDIAVALLETFHKQVERDERSPLILIFPHRPIVALRRSGGRPYPQLLRALEARGLQFIDLVETLAASELPVGALFTSTDHLSPAGNRLVARAVLERLWATGQSRVPR